MLINHVRRTYAPEILGYYWKTLPTSLYREFIPQFTCFVDPLSDRWNSKPTATSYIHSRYWNPQSTLAKGVRRMAMLPMTVLVFGGLRLREDVRLWLVNLPPPNIAPLWQNGFHHRHGITWTSKATRIRILPQKSARGGFRRRVESRQVDCVTGHLQIYDLMGSEILHMLIWVFPKIG